VELELKNVIDIMDISMVIMLEEDMLDEECECNTVTLKQK
jgi:hypothetical protein